MERILDAQFGEKGYVDAPDLRTGQNALSKASRNYIPLGRGVLRAWRGLSANGLGARQMFPFREGWAGLDDFTVGLTTTRGRGSVIAGEFGSCIFAGTGQLIIDGTLIPGEFASSIVRILLLWNGSYTDPQSGSYTVGISEPASPEVLVLDTPSSIVPNVTGQLSYKLAGFSTFTYDRSRASATSVTITPNSQPTAMVFPLAPAGLTTWAIFATEEGGGGRGSHLRMVRPNPYTNAEYLETDIQRNVTTLFVNNGSNIMTSTVAAFTAGDIGKRVSKTAGVPTLPNPTTITEVIDAQTVRLSNTATGSGNIHADLISYVNGRDRCALINYSEADLAAELAWIDDFVPPPVSHVGQCGKYRVYFTGGDAGSNVSQASGAIAQFSNKNYPGSVNPLLRIFLPAPVVDVLSRGIDNYMFVGLKTMIIAFQELDALNAPPATATVVLENEGILYPSNWCISMRNLVIFTNKKNLIRITENGAVDTQFSRDIAPILRTFDPEKTVVSSYPDGKAMTISCGRISLMYSDETESWSARLYLSDYAAGEICAAAQTADDLVITMVNGTNRNAYKFDSGNSAFVGAVTDYFGFEGRFPKTVQEIFALTETDTINDTVYFTFHRNYQPQFYDDYTCTGGSNIVSIPSGELTSDHIGYWVLLKGAGAGGGNLLGRIKGIVDPQRFELGTPVESIADSADLNCSTAVAEGYLVFAYRIFTKEVTTKGTQKVVNQRYVVPLCFSVAAGVFQMSDGTKAMAKQATVIGNERRIFGAEQKP